MSKTTKASSPKTLEQSFQIINDELLQMFIKKHKDYGKGNILAVKELGIAMRITEKAQRLIHLLTSDNTPENESISETWTDIAVYANVAKMYRRGEFQKLELGEEKKNK